VVCAFAGRMADAKPTQSAWFASALLLVLPLVAGSLAKLTGFAFGPLFVIPALALVAQAILAPHTSITSTR